MIGPRAALLLAGLASLTSGCVAAAIPIAAGAALAKRHAAIEETAKSERVGAASDRSELRVVLTPLTALPAPTAPAGNPAIAGLRSYVLAQAERAPGSGKRTSAIVPGASQLKVVRAACGALPAAVFVDLDPGRATFDPLAPGEAEPALGAALADLRERGVRVVWFSRLGVNFAAAAREALARAGLDPAGGDELVLMRDIAERKQSLRDEAATRLCPIAIVGDERADFDELYLYLKNPGSAAALDAMIGNGWFLASPFSAPTPAVPGGATP